MRDGAVQRPSPKRTCQRTRTQHPKRATERERQREREREREPVAKDCAASRNSECVQGKCVCKGNMCRGSIRLNANNPFKVRSTSSGLWLVWEGHEGTEFSHKTQADDYPSFPLSSWGNQVILTVPHCLCSVIMGSLLIFGTGVQMACGAP